MLFPLRDYNPTRTVPVVTIMLIAANVIVFAFQYMVADQPIGFTLTYGMVPWEVSHQQTTVLQLQDELGRNVDFERHVSPFLTLIYSLFLHGGFLHLFGNMLFLWIFGNNIEDALGKIRFLLFYLLSGVGSSLVHVLFNPSSKTLVIGASGAVSGVMGAYLILFPRARIRTLVFLFLLVTFVDIPAALFLIIWLLYQFLFAGGGGGYCLAGPRGRIHCRYPPVGADGRQKETEDGGSDTG